MQNRLELKLKELNPNLFGRLQETKAEVKLLLQKYASNFPEYTDHSIDHTEQVFEYAENLLSDEQIDNLNDDEIYVLSMACYLHDVGMCIPEEKIKEIEGTEEILEYRKNYPDKPVQDYIRDIHHKLSYKFIVEEWELLKIPNEDYAEAIGLVAQGHRKVDLGNFDIYEPEFIVKSGRTSVCLPYLGAIIRLADELDITNIRTPRLLRKYYMPANDRSIYEWNKHIATTRVSLLPNSDQIRFKVTCTDQKVYAALQEQFEKVDETILYAQKIIKNVSRTGSRNFQLSYKKMKVDYNYKGFDPKGIKFSFNVNNVVKTFIGENLYKNKLDALREVIQNAIDTCRYKKVLCKDSYEPEIDIEIKDDQIIISDNGLGMDEYIIENYFGKLASSYYQQESIKKDFEAIGQFGIGVFSYFLIAEYIDIETKTDENKALHFRIDKDPNSYFHFFKKANRKRSGTTITLYFKRDFEIETSIICDYIEKTFKYVEVPIILKSSFEEKKLTKLSFKFKEDDYISNALKYSHKGEYDKIKYLTYDFNEEKYEGSLTFFYHENLEFSSIINFMSFGESYSNRAVDIYQKGVYVYTIINRGNRPFLKFVKSTINLKSKTKINLDRNNFSSDSSFNNLLDSISESFANYFLKKIMASLDKEFLPVVSFNFFSSQYFLTKLENLIYLKTNLDNKEEILTLKEILNQDHEKIILVDKFTEKNIGKTLLISIEGCINRFSDQIDYFFFLSLFEKKYSFNFRYANSIWSVEFTKSIILNNKLEKLLNYDFTFSYSFENKDCICFKPSSHYSILFNLNHKFVIDLSEQNDKTILMNKKLLNEIFNSIDSMYYSIIKADENTEKKIFDIILLRLNSLLKILKEKTGITYTFTKKDFELE